MPDAELGVTAMKDVFFNNVFNSVRDGWRYTTALIGAHTLGGATLENSGYDGTWSDADDQGVFNNGYYRSLLLKGWGPETMVNGNSHKNQWTRVDHLTPKDQKQMMLNTDIGMVFDQNKDLAECKAKAEEDNKKEPGDMRADRKAKNKSRMKALKHCQKTFGNRKNKGLPGAEAQNGECCAWISTGCLKAKKAFASK